MLSKLKKVRLNEVVSLTAIQEQRIKAGTKTWIQHQVEKPITGLKRSRVGKSAGGIKRWLILERGIALILLLSPLFLVFVEGWPTEGKDSISAYYAMSDQKNLWAFYYPLTLGAFMFIVNGAIKGKSWYNIYLGVMLSGVILFNHTDFRVVHPIFALSFFIGNFIVVFVVKTGLFKKPVTEFFFDLTLVFIAALSGILFFFKVINLFYLEWISFAMITVHYFLLSYKKPEESASQRTGQSLVSP